MKILYYNWIQFDKKNNNGGGVNVYQKNLIDYLVNHEEYEIYFLSSGTNYSLFKKKPFYKKSTNVYGNKCKTFKIWNSVCTAPAASQHIMDNYLNDEETYNVFKRFIEEQGPFDVIHFNNIEGLTLKCLQVKKDFPNIKVIYSLHNYNLFCPYVSLFYNNEKNCIDYKDGKNCVDCMFRSPSTKSFILLYKLENLCSKFGLDNLPSRLKKIRKKILTKMKKKAVNEIHEERKIDYSMYKKFRLENVKSLNKYVDVILAVSNRVKDIAINMGVNEKKVYTNYIGTAYAKNSIDKPNMPNTNEFTIAFLGYLDPYKGFPFMVSALEKIDKKHANHLNVLCYARNNGTKEEMDLIERFNKLNNKFNLVEYHNGYTHDEFKNIMSRINLGIVPVIWEDNLPQVAIEYASHGVAVLSSDLGGANELSKSKKFIYDHSSYRDFINKLTYIMDNPEVLNEYFKNKMKLITMDEHIKQLLIYYGDKYEK